MPNCVLTALGRNLEVRARGKKMEQNCVELGLSDSGVAPSKSFGRRGDQSVGALLAAVLIKRKAAQQIGWKSAAVNRSRPAGNRS